MDTEKTAPIPANVLLGYALELLKEQHKEREVAILLDARVEGYQSRCDASSIRRWTLRLGLNLDVFRELSDRELEDAERTIGAAAEMFFAGFKQERFDRVFIAPWCTAVSNEEAKA